MSYFNAAAIANETYNQITGKNAPAELDTTALVDMGREMQAITSVDNVYGKMFNLVGKQIVLNKLYKGKFKQLYKTFTEYGSIIELIKAHKFTAEEDTSRAPVSGNRYDSFTVYNVNNPTVLYVENESGFQVTGWLPSNQLWTAFSSLEAMQKFIDAIGIEMLNAIEVRLEGIARAAMGNLIAHVADNNDANQYVNLLALYNTAFPNDTKTAAKVEDFHDSDFNKFAITVLKNYKTRIQDMTSLFNVAGDDTFTPAEKINLTLLNTFKSAADVYTYANTYHDDKLDFGYFNEVPFFQGSGTSYAFDDISQVKQKIKLSDGTSKSVTVDGVVGLMYDTDAIMCFNEHKSTTSFYNPDLDMTKQYSRYRAGNAVITCKNAVVFYIKDTI